MKDVDHQVIGDRIALLGGDNDGAVVLDGAGLCGDDALDDRDDVALAPAAPAQLAAPEAVRGDESERVAPAR